MTRLLCISSNSQAAPSCQVHSMLALPNLNLHLNFKLKLKLNSNNNSSFNESCRVPLLHLA